MADPAPSGNPTNFASLMSSLTSRDKEAPGPWDVSALADDVATISYEQALRTHRRVRSSEPPAVCPAIARSRPAALGTGQNLAKTASITIRLAESEQAQLRSRAAEAGLSVSAYLRSCIFEAESLRAQVKEVLSQVREATTQEPHVSDEKRPAPSLQKRFRLFSFWTRPHSARAES